MHRSASYCVEPKWNVLTGEWDVAMATDPGKQEVHGGTRAEFNAALQASFPPHARIVVRYPDAPVTLECGCK